MYREFAPNEVKGGAKARRNVLVLAPSEVESTGAVRAQARLLLSLQSTARNRAVAGLVQRWRDEVANAGLVQSQLTSVQRGSDGEEQRPQSRLAPLSVQALKRHTRQQDNSLGPPVQALDIATIPETDVLPYLANMKIYGAVGIPAGSDIEFEPGDKAALELRRDNPAFGNDSAITIERLLTVPSPILAAVNQGLLNSSALDRNLAAAFPGFLVTFQAVRASPRVEGFGQWAATKVVSARQLINGSREAANQLLDYIHELREVETRIPVLAPGETINIAERDIPGGGTQTADLTQSHGRQVEVKTVREPILDSRPVLRQLGDAVMKFNGALMGAGPYEAVIYASYSAPDVTPTGRGGARGTTTKSVDANTGNFQESFVPAAAGGRPASAGVTGNLGAQVLNWLQTSGAGGADSTDYVRVRVENGISFAFKRELASGWRANLMDDTSLPYVLTFASVGYLTLSWDGDHSETLGVLLHAVKILSLRIRVERFTIASAAYDEWGVKGAESYGWATPSELPTRMDLARVTAQEGLQLRIAIPEGAITELPWVTIDPDLRVRVATFTPAEAISGYATGWLDPLTPVGLGFELEIQELGRIKVTLREGPFAFDTRPGETLVLGCPLSEWISADRMLNEHVSNELKKAGFRA